MTRVERWLSLVLLAAVFGVPAVTLHAFVTHLGQADSIVGLITDPGMLGIVALAGISLAPALQAAAGLLGHWRLGAGLAALRALGSPAKCAGLPFTAIPVAQPLVCIAGWRSPSVLVSQGALDRMTPAMLHAALLHEDAHRRAGDHRWRPALAMLQAAFGFVPGIERLTQTMVLRSELAADQTAIARGAGRQPLFEAVVVCADPGLALPALGGGPVETRLARIAAPGVHSDATALPALPLAGLGTWALGLPLAAHALLLAGVLCHPAMG